MALLKDPGGFSEKKPVLQFLKDDKSDMTLTIDEPRLIREYVMHLSVPVMRPLNDKYLDTLMESDQDSWPPILVTLTNDGYICYDGQHRLKAAELLKRGTIRAKSTQFKNLNELIEATFRANLTHGLRASLATRSDYCYWLKITFPHLTQQDIAKKAGVNQSTVARAIDSRQKKQQEAVKEKTSTVEKEEETREKQAQNFTTSTGKFVKVASGFLKTIKQEEYEYLVQDLQLELLSGPEDRQVFRRVGQLLIDVSKMRRKAKTSA